MPSKLSQFGDLIAPAKSRKRAPGFTTTRTPGSSHKQSSPVLLAPPVRPVSEPPPPAPTSIQATSTPNTCTTQEPPFRLPQQVTPSTPELQAIAKILEIYDQQLAPGPIAQELLASFPAKPVQRHVCDRLQRIEQARQHLNQAATILLGLSQS